THGNGKFDKHKTFVEGLSIATSCVRGRGGVFVLNPPYLLFYADKNNDDIPDGDPEVLLEGFGLEDTHSVTNSLRWAPDGWHYVQGGYYQKGFSKHGSLSNPYAFGYFPAMKHHSVPRFTHTFLIYESEALPAPYRGKLFGVEPLQGQVVLSDVFRDRSSFGTKDLSRPISTTDQWFRPVDIKEGPDGAVSVADMHEP